jgi:large subunit ribosomal protein L1
MKKHSKRYEKILAQLPKETKMYKIDEAVKILKSFPQVKFNETVGLSFKIDMLKQSDQSIRGTVVLPNGLGKKVRVAVFCKGEHEKIAKDAGADVVGDAELVEKVLGGFLDFDVAIATPDMMREMGRLGKVLGPKGLMPNPKVGTVTTDVAKAVREAKAGRVEYRMDKQSNIHVAVGKISFEPKQLVENISTVIESVLKAKPTTLKGQYIKHVYMTKTMGPGLKLDISQWRE